MIASNDYDPDNVGFGPGKGKSKEQVVLEEKLSLSEQSRKHPSPLHAQRAEAEATGALVIDDLAAPISSRDPYSSMRAAATAAWLTLDAKEIEVRKYFRSIAVASGLELLAKMRHQCNLAAETLQQRMDEGNTERCTGCNKTLEECRKSAWLMQGSDMDADTGVPVPYRFCGPLCIRERNRERMLPPEQRKDKRVDGQDFGDVL
jgi:heterodisulfide reductase subunit A-like polyferredoxin